MKRYIAMSWFVVALGSVLLVIGCASYYKVTEPQSGKEYYTQKVETDRGGAVKLKDARTGSVVTIQNSEVKEITSKEYEAGLAAPISKPTPTVAPVTAPTATIAPVTAPTATPAAAPAVVPAAAATGAPAAAPAAPAAEPSSAPSGT